MKKAKFITVMSMIFISSVFMFSGCKKNLLMDEHKCAEVALEYMENKYKEEFEVLDSGEVGKFIGKAGYAEVKVRNKSENTENEYFVVVYPDGSDDKDDDGYCDRYKVISDTYMCHLLKDSVKSEMDKLLVEVGLAKFIGTLSIEEKGGGEGFYGFSSKYIYTKEEFSLEKLLDSHKVSIHYWLEIPESEYNTMLQENIEKVIKPFLTEDLVIFSVEIYNDERYTQIEEYNVDGTEYYAIGDNSLRFSIYEEEK